MTNKKDEEIIKKFVSSGWQSELGDRDTVNILEKELTKLISQVRQEAYEQGREDVLKHLLMEKNVRELEGRGYDFYFAIRTLLDGFSHPKDCNECEHD